MQPLPGFRDFLPGDCATRNYIFECWREVARMAGFVEWDGPVLEPTELYNKKSGNEIVDQLFNFIDKGQREVALRPELTNLQAVDLLNQAVARDASERVSRFPADGVNFWIKKRRTIWIVDAHRDNGKRFVVRAEQKLTAFIELE